MSSRWCAVSGVRACRARIVAVFRAFVLSCALGAVAHAGSPEPDVAPVVRTATYLGGNGEDNGGGIHVDATGLAIGATSGSTDLPTPGAEQPANAGGLDAYVAKLDPAAARVLVATYFGGSGDETQRDLVADANGDLYVLGETTSTDLPTTPGAADPTCGADGVCGGGPDVFVAKLDGTTGALLWATYIGGSGSDIAGKIAVDASGSAYVSGYTNSIDLPVSSGSLDPSCGNDGACDDAGEGPRRDCFVAKLAPDGGSLAWATYLGGGGFDRCFAIDVDGNGRAVVAGSTFSADFPATPNASDSSCGSDGTCDSSCVGDVCVRGDDAFVAMLASDGSALVYATYLGGSGDGDGAVDEYVWDVTVDESGRAWVVGQTDSVDLATPNGADTSFGGVLDAFVAELSPDGTELAFATYLGGAGEEQGFGIARDSGGTIHVTGVTTSLDFPRLGAFAGPGNACTNCESGFTEAFVASFASDGSELFSSWLGGSSSEYGSNLAIGPGGLLYLLGDTASTDFPTRGALQGEHGAIVESDLPYDAYLVVVPEPAACMLGLAAVAAGGLLGRMRRC